MVYKRTHIGLGCIAMVIGVAAQTSRANALASWNFDSLTTVQSVLHVSASSGSGTITFGALSPADGLIHQVREGNGSPQSLAFSDVDIGEFVQIHTSTLGQSDVGVQWFQNGTANGTHTWDFQYSTDGSTFFTGLDDYFVPFLGIWHDDQTNGTSFSVDLSSVSALNNQSNVWFRFIAVDDGNDLGLNQIDDVVVLSNVPEPTSLALLSLGGIGLLRRRDRR